MEFLSLWIFRQETLESGKGYAVLKNRNVPDDPAPNTVNYRGIVLSGPQSAQISSIGNGWNSIGIPYPSAILADLFIAANEEELSDAFAGIYLWKNGAWRSIIAGSGTIIQSGQGFFIKAKPGATSVIFNPQCRGTIPLLQLNQLQIIFTK